MQGRTVLLTGAAGGHGRVAARLMAEQGARLILADIDPAVERQASELGRSAIAVQLDVSREEDWGSAVDRALANFGSLDVLINNAAVAGRDRLADLTAERLRGYLDINLIGALNGIRAVVPIMRRAGGGSILNIASISAMQATPGLVGYGISKWALRGLSRNAAAEFAGDNIRVNLLLPGASEVRMIVDRQAGADKAEAATSIPLGRAARAEEIARAMMFIASDAASYVSGAELTVDGAWTA